MNSTRSVALSRIDRRLLAELPGMQDGTNMTTSERFNSGQKYGDFVGAPHHPEIASYPHHLHQQDGGYPSQVRSLSDVFELIAKLLQD